MSSEPETLFNSSAPAADPPAPAAEKPAETMAAPAKDARDPRLDWPSVTQILKIAGLSPWQDVTLDMIRRGLKSGVNELQLRYILQGVKPEVLDAKAELGTNVHLAIHDIETGLSVRWWEGESYEPYIAAYLKFREECSFQAAALEEKVFNNTYQYNGRLDARGSMGKFKVLLDVKTTSIMPEDLAYQLAGYDLCLEPDPKRLRFGLQLKPDGKYTLHEYKNRKDDEKVFFAALLIAKTKGNQG